MCHIQEEIIGYKNKLPDAIGVHRLGGPASDGPLWRNTTQFSIRHYWNLILKAAKI